MRRVRHDPLEKEVIRIQWRARTLSQKQPWQAVFAMTLSAYNGTPVQPQTQPMGTASRDPRRG